MSSNNIGGRSPLACQAAQGTVARNQTATGSTQATALNLGSDHTHFSTVGSGAGAKLNSLNGGDVQTLFNGGVNALTVYPPVGGTLNGGSLNAGVSVPAGKGALFVNIDALTLYAIISA